MARSIDLSRHSMIALTRSSLVALRAAMLRDAGSSAAVHLQEAGYAGGDALFASFRDWLAERTSTQPDALELRTFESMASAYFRETGWGSVTISTLNDAVATIDSEDWGEADPNATGEQPACHLTTGLFADFFGRLADAPLAVLEVECRSSGSPRCRFLVGSIEVMEHLYEQMGLGKTYLEAVETLS
jgi:predicted hydrocarbon binding protein